MPKRPSATTLFSPLLVLLMIVSLAIAIVLVQTNQDPRRFASETSNCNKLCTENAQCPSNMVCWPYGRPSSQQGYCRLDSNPNSDTCQQKAGTGFIVQVYNDKNADGRRSGDEEGLSWNLTWDKNGNESWTSYVTYGDHNGEGGRVGDLAGGDRIRVRIGGQSGWEITTPTEQQSSMKENETHVVYFGARKFVPVTQQAPAVGSTAMTKGGLGGPVQKEEIVKASPTPSPTLSPSSSPSNVTYAKDVAPQTTSVPQKNILARFIDFILGIFRAIYCKISGKC